MYTSLYVSVFEHPCSVLMLLYLIFKKKLTIAIVYCKVISHVLENNVFSVKSEVKTPHPHKKKKRINNLERKDVYILFVKGQKTLSTP